ncbi:MAG TPA: response regulator [Geminicoccaceae bacterium]|nr:response regulator [Geminicoccus sp.]HMU51081.1 response regulator [Geminicoccaceae bacterium]
MARDAALAGLRVLVVEDEFLIALDVGDTLGELGCEVVGPVPTVAAGLDLLQADGCELAVLDVRLRDGSTAPLAQALAERGVPFVMLTGYERSQIDEPLLRAAPIVAKPLQRKALRAALLAALAGRPA